MSYRWTETRPKGWLEMQFILKGKNIANNFKDKKYFHCKLPFKRIIKCKCNRSRKQGMKHTYKTNISTNRENALWEWSNSSWDRERVWEGEGN